MPAIDPDPWPFSSLHLLDPLLSPRGRWKTGKVGLMVAGDAPWRLDPCEPTSIEIILSLFSLPVEAEKCSRLEGKAAVQPQDRPLALTSPRL